MSITDDIIRSPAFETVKRYAILAYGALGTMFDVGLMVLGSLLVGLSIAVLLAGFGLADVAVDLSTGALLVSAVVLAVVGLFCLGLASEGPLGRGRRLVGFELWEVAVGRVLAVLAVGFGAILLHGLVSGLLDGLPEPLHKGAEGLRVVGVAGMTVVPLLGIPLSLLMRWLPVDYEWVHRADVPALFVVWAVASLMMLA